MTGRDFWAGNMVEFRRKGPVSFILGNILRLFYRDWDFWGWHCGFLRAKVPGGWLVYESTAKGPETNLYTDDYLALNCRIWPWLKETPTTEQVDRFCREHDGKRYDVAVYFWTTVAILIRHFFNRPIPKLLDDRFSCWELVAEFYAEMSQRIVSKYDTIILPDILRAIKEGE